MPEPKRYDELKSQFVERAEAARTRAEDFPDITDATGRRSRAFAYMARAAAATALVLLVVLGMGLASTYAMPGNPLYSVKRLTEDIHRGLAIGGERKANINLSNAGRRIDELDYVLERGMDEWYFPLSRDAASSISRADREASSLDEEGAERLRNRARSQAERLEPALKQVYPAVDRLQREELDRDYEMLRRRLGKKGGQNADGGEAAGEGPGGSEDPATPGSEGQDGNRKGNDEGQQQDRPSGGEQDQEGSQLRKGQFE